MREWRRPESGAIVTAMSPPGASQRAGVRVTRAIPVILVACILVVATPPGGKAAPVRGTGGTLAAVRVDNARFRIGEPRDRARLAFDLTRRATVFVRVRDRHDRVVSTLIAGRRLPAGTTVTHWAGGGSRGRLLHAGRYRFFVSAIDRNWRRERVVRRVAGRHVIFGWRSSHTFTYDVSRRGSVRASMETFRRIGRLTYADFRGWSLRGHVRFRRVHDNGQFHLILASPSSVAAAGSVCSWNYSCTVGNQVLINVYRWKRTTPTWPLSRRLYRSYVINHETGHWLGLGHRYCPRRGAPAPVMQQQSKGLQGCKANVWPLGSERAAASRIHGVARWPYPARGMCTIVGTDEDDVLWGSAGADVICGFSGRDELHGRGGPDVLVGGPGRDVLRQGSV